MARNNHHYTTHFKDGLRVRRTEAGRADTWLKREIEDALLELEVFDDGLDAYLDEEYEMEEDDLISEEEEPLMELDLGNEEECDDPLLSLYLDEEEGDDYNEGELWGTLDESFLWPPYTSTAILEQEEAVI